MIDGAVAILEFGVIILAIILNPSYRRREIEKALTMEQSGENTARSSFADDALIEEMEEDPLIAERSKSRRMDIEQGEERRGRSIDVDETPLLE